MIVVLFLCGLALAGAAVVSFDRAAERAEPDKFVAGLVFLAGASLVLAAAIVAVAG